MKSKPIWTSLPQIKLPGLHFEPLSHCSLSSASRLPPFFITILTTAQYISFRYPAVFINKEIKRSCSSLPLWRLYDSGNHANMLCCLRPDWITSNLKKGRASTTARALGFILPADTQLQIRQQITTPVTPDSPSAVCVMTQREIAYAERQLANDQRTTVDSVPL